MPADLIDDIRKRVASRDIAVAVVGLGYVGLPLAHRFADVGFRVTGLDEDEDRVGRVNRGDSYIADVRSSALAEVVAEGRLRATRDDVALADADLISICVPTPLSKFREPDLSAVVKVGERIASRLRRGHVVVLESTTYPGTTEELLLPLLSASGLHPGEDFFLAFSPERVDPGREDYTISNTARVIGGVTPRCTRAAAAIYGAAIDPIVEVSSARCAEMVKMLENTFRSVNIGLVNEIALMCDRLGIPVFEVVRAAASKPFGFMPFWPGPGLGGHCIPIDPLYLSWKMRSLDYRARFIELAEEVNRSMPLHVVDKVFRALNSVGLPVRGSKVLILGVAYKPDVDDVRESPAIDVINRLQVLEADIRYHDPFVPRIEVGGREWRSMPLDDALRGADCGVIVTNHRAVDYERVVRECRVVVDARDATAGLRHLGRVTTI